MNALVSAALAAAALRGGVELSDRSEVRVRSAPDTGGPVVDVETAPRAVLTLDARTWQLEVGYTPRFTASAVGTSAQQDLLQTALMTATIRDRRATLAIRQGGTWGRQSFANLQLDPAAPGGIPRIDLLRAQGSFDFASSLTSVRGTFAATRRLSLAGGVDLSFGGGADAPGRQIMPFLTQLTGDAGAVYRASRFDWVTTTLSASRAIFSNGADDSLLQGVESWRHAFSRNTEWSVSAGAALRGSRGGPLTADPVADTSFYLRVPPSRLDFRISARLAPILDRLSGLIGERVEIASLTGFAPTRAFSVQAQLGASLPLSRVGPDALALGFGALVASYRVHRSFQIDGGARAFATAGAPPGIAPFQWVSFLGVTLTAPKITF